MEYTVKQLAELAGVSARTLRYYEQLGLLPPARRGGNGYRYYGPGQVDRLQQILFYRALGFGLEDIRACLDAPGFDETAALRGHLARLQQQQRELARLICTVEKTIRAKEEHIPMKDHEKFEGLKQRQLQENEAAYGKEARSRYGDGAVNASNQKFAGLSPEQYERMQELGEQINQRLAAAVQAGLDPAGEEGAAIARLHREWLGFTWPHYSPEAHRGLAMMYVQDERFTAYYDAQCPGCAAFLQAAICAHV